jgi:hypothetical protein
MSLSEVSSQLSKYSYEVEDIRRELNRIKVESNSKIAVLQGRLDKLIGTGHTQKPLKEYVLNILNESCEPLTVNEITQLVLEAGYKTQSKNFKKIVFLALTSSKNIFKATRAKTRPTRFEVLE